MNNKDDNAVENSIVAVATVIQVQAPTSAKPGDKAFIRANGVIDGWVGGGCVQPAVNAISREVLNSGQPCLLRVAPDGKWQPVERWLPLSHHQPASSGEAIGRAIARI